MPIVGDVMDTGVVSVAPSVPIMQVAQKMLVNGNGVIPVCHHSKFRGVISERDIVVGIVAVARDPVTEPATSAMNIRHPVISPTEDILQAAKVMISSGVQALPVVKDKILVGMITLEELAAVSEALAAMVFSKTAKLKSSAQNNHQIAPC